MRGGGCQTPPRVSSTGYWGPSSEPDPIFWWLQCDFSPSGLNETVPNIPTRGRLGPWKHVLRKLGSTAGAAAFPLARPQFQPCSGLRKHRRGGSGDRAGRGPRQKRGGGVASTPSGKGFVPAARATSAPVSSGASGRTPSGCRHRRAPGSGSSPSRALAPDPRARPQSPSTAGSLPAARPEGPRGTSGRPPWSHLPTPFQGHRGPHSGQAAPPPRPGFQPRPPAERRAVPRPGSATPTVGGRQPADPASEGGRAPPGRGSPRRRPQPRAPPGPVFHRPGHARHAQATPLHAPPDRRLSAPIGGGLTSAPASRAGAVGRRGGRRRAAMRAQVVGGCSPSRPRPSCLRSPGCVPTTGLAWEGLRPEPPRRPERGRERAQAHLPRRLGPCRVWQPRRRHTRSSVS